MLTEKRKTLRNRDSEIMEARVIANYGDPGLDEDYHFDLLSKYVIVMIESVQRVLTSDKHTHMLAVVKRPENLWIQTVNDPNGNVTNQRRMDFKQNVNIGLADAYSVKGINRISPAYAMGESIRIRKLSQPISIFGTEQFFYSAFTTWDETSWGYNQWHSEGSTLPGFNTSEVKNVLRHKTLERDITIADPHTFRTALYNRQYEAFMLTLNHSDEGLAQGMTALFDGSWNGNGAVYTANGGYCFHDKDHITLSAVGFEDINVGQKARVATNECIPLVVTTPNTFPVPSIRQLGTIQYTPTYSTVVVQ